MAKSKEPVEDIPEYVHMTSTIRKDTADALEGRCTRREGDQVFTMKKSNVVDDALRYYLGMPPVDRK